MERRIEIDRILDREAIGRPWPVGAGIGVAGDAAVEDGDEIGIAAVDQRAVAPRHLGEIGRCQLERRGALADGLLVDGGNGGKVGLDGGPDFGC